MTGDPCYVDWQNGRRLYDQRSLLAVIRKSSPDIPDPDLFMFALAGKFHGYFPGYSKGVERTKNFLTWMVPKAQTKNTAGFVRLKSADPRDRPEINFMQFNDPDGAKRDLDAIVKESISSGCSKHNTAIKQEVIPGPGTATGDQIGQFVQDNAGAITPSSRTGREAGDPEAVVDSNFRVILVFRTCGLFMRRCSRASPVFSSSRRST